MVGFFLTVVFFLFICAVMVVGGAFFWRHWYRKPTAEDEILYIHTVDGWRLALHRYKPRAEGKGLPVILCHGLSSNRYCFDMEGLPSLARYLRDQGLDVWVPELRGSGMSDKPSLWASDIPYTWGFNDHLTKDVPAIIAAVQEGTGASKLHWVGHSMGGMLIRVQMSENPDLPLASAVTIGSPVDFTAMGSTLRRAALRLKWLIRAFPFFLPTFLAGFLVPVANQAARHVIGGFYPPNLGPASARKLMATVTELVTASSIWLEFGRFVETGTFGPTSSTRYLDPNAQSPVPLLVLAGSKDELAPAAAVIADEGPKNKERVCKILGREQGDKEDYGHLDLLTGRHCVEEVFPLIRDWIRDHNG